MKSPPRPPGWTARPRPVPRSKQRPHNPSVRGPPAHRQGHTPLPGRSTDLPGVSSSLPGGTGWPGVRRGHPIARCLVRRSARGGVTNAPLPPGACAAGLMVAAGRRADGYHQAGRELERLVRPGLKCAVDPLDDLLYEPAPGGRRPRRAAGRDPAGLRSQVLTSADDRQARRPAPKVSSRIGSEPAGNLWETNLSRPSAGTRSSRLAHRDPPSPTAGMKPPPDRAGRDCG
jgi:hypothetical protein